MYRLLLAAALASLLLPAQTTFGSITGVVTDPSSAAVPNARIVVNAPATGARSTTQTNENGIYTVAQLKEGRYELTVEANGFRAFVSKNIDLAARDNRRLDVSLEVGDTRQSIEVEADSGLLETESARVSDNKTGAQMNTLPVTSRGLRSFLMLSPTVVQGFTGDGNRIRVGGGTPNQNEFTIDGISINNGLNNNAMPQLISYIESFEEVRVDSSNNPAEYGAMGQVTVVSKSGDNKFRGSAFNYYSSPVFRARNPFASERGSGIVHQPGYSIGGPIVKSRTFFFHSLEGARGGSQGQLLNANVPLAAWRQGDFGSAVIRDPNGGNFPNNRIPASRLNSVSTRLQDRFFPLPNFGDTGAFVAGNFRQTVSRPFDNDTYTTARLDHQFSQRHQIFARATYNRVMFTIIDGNLPALGRIWQRRDSRNLSLSYTWTLSSNMVNELRGGTAYNNTPRSPSIQGNELVRELGLQGLANDIPGYVTGMPRIQWQNLGLTNIQNSERYRKPGFKQHTYTLQNITSYFRGKHSFKWGLNFLHVNSQDQQEDPTLFGSAQFSNRYTGQTYADFLLGIPTQVQRAFPSILTDQARSAVDFFVADDYKITSRLTLNVGLRYEWHPGWTAANGLQSVFDISSGKIVIPDGTRNKVSALMPTGYVDVVEASSAGLPSALVKTDRNNFAPRLGAAWRPFGTNTVFRSGFSMFYDLINRPPAVGVPFQVNEPVFNNPATNPTVVFPRIFPAASAGPTSVTLPSAMRADLRIPLSMQYSFTAEHQRKNRVYRATYLGTNTRHGELSQNINQPVADTRPFVDKPRAFPNYPAIGYITNGANHSYHGLTIELEQRSKKGLQWQAAYTWARDIGDFERGDSPEDAYNNRRERRPFPDIPTGRFVGSVIHDLPALSKFSPVLKSAFGGWTVSSTYTQSTGNFLSAIWTGPDPTGTRFANNRTPPQVNLRPDILRNPNLSEPTVTRWFDPAAFAAPQAGRFGTSGPGVIIGPGLNILNAGVYKTFTFRERVRLRLEFTGSNALNRANYNNPATNISNLGQAGVINSIRSGLDLPSQRDLRTGLRVEF
jgi:hypothetical protein